MVVIDFYFLLASYLQWPVNGAGTAFGQCFDPHAGILLFGFIHGNRWPLAALLRPMGGQNLNQPDVAVKRAGEHYRTPFSGIQPQPHNQE
jgi:hypothetical protein